MKFNIIFATIASMLGKLKGKNSLGKMVIQSFILILSIYLCIFIYNKWTQPMNRYMVVNIETLGYTAPKSISVVKNLSVYGDANNRWIRDTTFIHRDRVTVRFKSENKFARDKYFVNVSEEMQDSIFSRDSLVQDITRVTLFVSNSRKLKNDTIKDFDTYGFYYKSTFHKEITIEDFEGVSKRGSDVYTKYVKKRISIPGLRNVEGNIYDYLCVKSFKPLAGDVTTDFLPYDYSSISTIFSSCNISESNFIFVPIFNWDTKIDTLSFIYTSPSITSQIIPSPDEQDLYHITYTDSLKLAEISKKGISFTSTSVEGERLQESRLNLLIMIGTLLFTLLMGLLYKIVIRIFHDSENNYNILFLIADLLLIPICCTFHCYKYGEFYITNTGIWYLSILFIILVIIEFFKKRILEKNSLHIWKSFDTILFRAFIKSLPHIILVILSAFITKYMLLILFMP